MPRQPIDRGVTRFAQLQMCRACGYPFDAAGTYDGSAGTPTPGSVMLCLNCNALGICNDDCRTQRALTPEEQASFDRGDAEWATARLAIASNARAKRLGVKTKYAERGPGRPN